MRTRPRGIPGWLLSWVGLSVETVRKWRSRFTESGTAGLADAARPGRQKADLMLTGAEREQLARWGPAGQNVAGLVLRAKNSMITS